MQTYFITFLVDVDAEDVDTAIHEARMIISDPWFSPANIEIVPVYEED